MIFVLHLYASLPGIFCEEHYSIMKKKTKFKKLIKKYLESRNSIILTFGHKVG